MKSVKLSECKNEIRTFLFNKNTVTLQYILRMIWNGKKLPKIELCYDEKAFDAALASSLAEMSNDIMNGVDKEYYELSGLKTIPVEVDITKDNIRQIDDEGYEFEII